MGDEYSGMAVASFVLAIFGFLGGNIILFIPGILAIIFGFIGLKRIKTNQRKGKALALVGIILSFVFLLLIPFLVGVLWVIIRNIFASGGI